MNMIVDPYRFGPGGGGAPAPTSTKWRLYFPTRTYTTGAPSSSIMGLAEVEMRGSVGGADQCSGGTASASTEYSGSKLAANAFANDGGTSTWASTNNANTAEWLQYEFASAVTVEEVSLLTSADARPTSVFVQYDSTGLGDWVTYFTSDLGTKLAWGSSETHTLSRSVDGDGTDRAGYAMWRLYFDSGASGTYLELIEVQMRETASGADECWGNGASASNNYDSNRLPYKAFDDSTGGYPWVPSSPTNGTGLFLEFDFIRPTDVVEFTIRCNGANTGPQQVSLEYYDGSTWQNAYTSASGLSWAAAETKTFTLP